MSNKTDWASLQRTEKEKVHQQQLLELQREIKKYAEALHHVSAERDAALSISKQRIVPVSIKPSAGEGSEATAFAILGDWHVEETVDPKTVNGLNEHNLEIADRKIAKAFQSILRITEIERAGTRIENLVICMLGDMMTGYIHEELQESNGLSPTETILWLRKRIVAGLNMLIQKGGFKKIIVTCNYGNHGRTTKKSRHATGAQNSYEWMLYHVLKDDVPAVEWHIADGYHLFLQVYDFIFRIHHGDNVQYQGGIGGLTIPMEKAIASWNKARQVYCDIIGHHHISMQAPRWICNGALIGYGAYALSIKAAFEHPSQTYFLLDSKRGRTGTFPIYLT